MRVQRQVKRRSRCRVYRYLMSMLIVVLFLLMMVIPAGAYGISGSGNWIDMTWFCTQTDTQPICVPILANHKADVHVEYYYVDSYHRVVYWQDFGGMIYPGTSACGNHDWSKGSTFYETSWGDVPIGGWFSTGAWCMSGSVCRNYHSDAGSWLTCSTCEGRFKSSTWFTNRCFPNLVPFDGHLTSVAF